MRPENKAGRSYEALRLTARTFARIPWQITSILWMAALLASPTAAQQPGPINPPDANRPTNSSTTISTEAPSVPVDQIIQRFAASEAEFKRERDNYTYTQTFVMQTIDASGKPDGEYRMVSDIVFSPTGKRYDKVTYAPTPTLQRVSVSEQDLADLQNVQP